MDEYKCLLVLLKAIVAGDIDRKYSNTEMTYETWHTLLDVAKHQGLVSVLLDAISQLECKPPQRILLQWIGCSLVSENIYYAHLSTICELADFYRRHNIKMMLLKGYGLSLNYPTPNNRPPGDVDIYLYGDGGKADELMFHELGIISKQNEEKHSVFTFNGVTVENHSCLINNITHPSVKTLEKFFEADSQNAIPIENVSTEASGFYIPSVTTNVLYLPYHMAEHFVHGDASLRQLLDWAMFVKRYTKQICWEDVEERVKQAGFIKFYSCINGLCMDFLGMDASYFPKWKRNRCIESRVLNEILSHSGPSDKDLYKKIIRFFKNYWKYRLVYNENIIISAIRQARAYALVKWNVGSTIWKKK